MRSSLGTCEGLTKGPRRLVHEPDELANVLVREPQTCEIHERERTRKRTHSHASRCDALTGDGRDDLMLAP